MKDASVEVLRAEIERLGPWHHDVEVVPGVRTGELRPSRVAPELGEVSIIRPDSSLPLVLEDVYPDGLGGRTVLDCACNAGGYLFAATDLGASRAFGFDVRSHWIRQAEFLKTHRGAANVEFAQCDLMNLPDLRVGRFDVTLFFGIFYHLADPIAGLRMAADHTNELLIVNTAVRPARQDALLLNVESETEVMSGVHRVAWLPTGPRVLQELLAWCGFPESRVQFESRDGAHGRVQLLAARDRATLASYDRVHPAATPSRFGRYLRRLRGWR